MHCRFNWYVFVFAVLFFYTIFFCFIFIYINYTVADDRYTNRICRMNVSGFNLISSQKLVYFILFLNGTTKQKFALQINSMELNCVNGNYLFISFIFFFKIFKYNWLQTEWIKRHQRPTHRQMYCLFVYSFNEQTMEKQINISPVLSWLWSERKCACVFYAFAGEKKTNESVK